jgi:hypothetical protein
VVASTARPAKKGDANIATARLADADANEVEGPGVEEPVASVGETQEEDEPEIASGEDEAGPALDGQPTAERKLDAAIPDFLGMTVGQAVRAARRAGVELVPDGSGIAATQTPAPGPGVRGMPCRVSFRNGG